MLNWDDLRIFLEVARKDQLLAAARSLGLDHTTVARRISSLEAAVGIRLINRSPRGISLTAAGNALFAHAERIEAEAFAATTELSEKDARVSGVVRLATPEAFGTYLIAPNIHRLYDRHPDLQLELLPESRTVSLSKREADLAIALSRPPRGRIVARRLVEYRLGLYASAPYLARHDPIADVAALRNHPVVCYVDQLIEMPELRYLDQIVANARTTFRSSSIAAQHNAVAAGFGIGILHRFAAAQDVRLEPVLEGVVEATRGYWLLFHADQQRLPRIRAVSDFIDELVEAERARF